MGNLSFQEYLETPVSKNMRSPEWDLTCSEHYVSVTSYYHLLPSEALLLPQQSERDRTQNQPVGHLTIVFKDCSQESPGQRNILDCENAKQMNFLML